MQRQHTRREQTRILNTVIDNALLQPCSHQQQQVLKLGADHSVDHLAERIRRRATRLGRQHPQLHHNILITRDELITQLYASLAPNGWATAWCDGSSIKQQPVRAAGIGVIVMDASGVNIERISRFIGNRTAFAAEIMAVVAALEIAGHHNIEKLRVYTDNKALVQLWCTQREDPRLQSIRQAAEKLKHLEILAIPRLHNQIANALAKQAATGSETNSDT